MKKWRLLIVLLIAALATWWVIQKKQKGIDQNTTIGVNAKLFIRTFPDEKMWAKWWPGKVEEKNNAHQFLLNGNSYTIVEKKFSSLVINISGQQSDCKAELLFIQAQPDSVKLIWRAADSTQKLCDGMAKDMAAINKAIATFYNNEDHIYGHHIEKSFVVDSSLISTATETTGYPQVAQIYGLIDKLKAYAASQSAAVNGFPMLNLSTTDSVHYKIQVALPLNKRLPNSGDIHYKWMLGGGNILVAEVKGGAPIINEGFKAMEQYVDDYGRVAPAIHFQSLVTDRRLQLDSTKWVTKLFWPVM